MATGRVPATGQVIRANSPSGMAPPTLAAGTYYAGKTADDGWLQALGAASQLVPLCKYTKLKVTGNRNGRTYFEVLDGPQRGRSLSLKDANAVEYLGLRGPRNTAIKIVVNYRKFDPNWYSEAQGRSYEQQLASLSCDAEDMCLAPLTVTMNSVWEPGAGYYPLPEGSYPILIPDTPHSGLYTRFYRRVEPTLRNDQVWFPIRYGDNSRYIHVGNVSEGCVTVVDLANWVTLHELLVSHRAPDGKHVGNLTVIGKPERAGR